MNIRLLFLIPLIFFHSSPFTEGTSKMERFHLKHQNCEWTDEMGKFIYKCIVANNGFNAQWCHNETIALYCDAKNTAK